MKRISLFVGLLCSIALGLGIGNTQEVKRVVDQIIATTCTNQFVRAIAASGTATCATASLTADVTGTLPIANGGTNDTGTAWASYTPTAACGSGTITTSSVSGAFKTIGKTVYFRASVNITSLGTCGTSLTLTTPTGSTGTTPISGINATSSNAVISVYVQSGLGNITLTPAANNYFIAGTYESS